MPEHALGGHVEPPFDGVRAEFAHNFAIRNELGASVCVIHHGRIVVDLWGGFVDAARRTPWRKDTVAVVFSSTKGATALCAHMLASRGELDLDQPVAHYWPQFNQAGKHNITTRICLAHQAGLPGVSHDISPSDARNPSHMAEIMAGEPPLWPPGTSYGYHPLTFGWLIGEIVHRVTDMTLGAFFAQEVATPLGLEFWLGIPAEIEPRVAPAVSAEDGDELPDGFGSAVHNGQAVQHNVLRSFAGTTVLDLCASPPAYGCEIAGGGGIANARGLANLYAPLSLHGSLNGVTLVEPNQITSMAATHSAAFKDRVFFEPGRHTAGFEKAPPGARLPGSNGIWIAETAFGHSGLGGSVGFADPAAGLAFGYAMNRQPSPDEAPTARCQPLIDACYQAVAQQSSTGRSGQPS